MAVATHLSTGYQQRHYLPFPLSVSHVGSLRKLIKKMNKDVNEIPINPVPMLGILVVPRFPSHWYINLRDAHPSFV